MSDIHTGPNTTSLVTLCPSCGSASVDVVGGTILNAPDAPSTCKGCGWEGRRDQLVGAVFQHQMGSDAQILHTIVNDLRNSVAKQLSLPIGRFLLKWGFLNTPVDARELSRYMVAVAQAMLRAVFETREQIEKERTHGG